MKIKFLYNYTSITWREINNLRRGDIGTMNKMIAYIQDVTEGKDQTSGECSLC